MSTERFYTSEIELDIPANTVFYLNGIKIKTREKNDCEGCMFFVNKGGIKHCEQLDVFKVMCNMRCHSSKRADGKTVIFQEVKE